MAVARNTHPVASHLLKEWEVTMDPKIIVLIVIAVLNCDWLDGIATAKNRSAARSFRS
jgi:hypothetical protein